MMQTDKKMDDGFYIAGLCAIGLIAVYSIIAVRTEGEVLHFSYPCMIHLWTGYYCPGCGGTRAVAALLHGKILESLRYHPIVPYTAAVGGWFMLTQTLQRISGNRWKIGMHFRTVYLWIALAMIAGNCIIKNLALAVWKVDLLM